MQYVYILTYKSLPFLLCTLHLEMLKVCFLRILSLRKKHLMFTKIKRCLQIAVSWIPVFLIQIRPLTFPLQHYTQFRICHLHCYSHKTPISPNHTLIKAVLSTGEPQNKTVSVQIGVN